ncbi:DUF2283 domain-containing protein [Streptomyces sp. NPDC001102]
MINLDFDEQGRLIGIEVLAASSKLPAYMLQSAERLDTEGACSAGRGTWGEVTASGRPVRRRSRG